MHLSVDNRVPFEQKSGCNRPLIFLEHDFGGLDHHCDFIALFKAELLRTAASDYALDLGLPDAHDDMRHDVAEGDFRDLSFELITR